MQENNTILEEIKVINSLLIGTKVVISEENTIPRAVEGVAEHGEGLIVKLLFNSLTVNLNLASQYADKKVNYCIFRSKLCTLICLFLSLTMYLDHAVNNQTVTFACSQKLSTLPTSHFRWNTIGNQVRHSDFLFFHLYF